MIRGIQELHRARSSEGGNINEHLPLLYMLSLDSYGVAEIGIDRGVSTSAMLAGQDTRITMGLEGYYIGVDISQACAVEVSRLHRTCNQKVTVTFHKASSVQMAPIAEVDFLLIDSLHTEETIRREIEIHSPKVRKWIALHDTVTFGENGETPGTRGILYGIDELMSDKWMKIYDSPRNNGMAVFRRR